MAGSGTAHLRDEGETLLRAEHMTVEFPVGRSGLKVHAVSDVSLDVKKGETLGLVGESGCGKSTTGRALLQFPSPTAGSVLFDGTELTELKGEDLRGIRTRMQMIFQDPISALNPRRQVGQIVTEPLSIWSEPKNEERAATTTVAAAIGFALGAVMALCGLVYAVLGALAVAGVGDDRVELGPLSVDATTGGGFLGIVIGVGLVSIGVGVASVARSVWSRTAGARSSLIGVLTVLAAAALIGFLIFSVPLGTAVVAVVAAAVVAGLLNLKPSSDDFPDVDEEGLALAKQVLHDVGLDPDVAWEKRPHEFSGGQCQRISIARALVLDPQLIICDEPVSALDVSVQAQILNLLEDTKQRYGLTLVFIAHDLAVVKNVSDRVAVMYLGKLCEVAGPDTLYARPAHPYTDALLQAIPVPDPAVHPVHDDALSGDLPSPISPPSGCRFRTRCPKAQELCAQAEPEMRPVETNHFVACHYPLVDID